MQAKIESRLGVAASGGGGGAGTDLHYITTQSEASLSAETVLGTGVILPPDTLANRPAASLAGRIFPCTTNGFIYRDNATTWDFIGSSLLLGTSSTTALAGNTPLNSVTVPTGDVSINSHKLTNVTDPTNAQDAATLSWVLSQIAGLDAKDEVAYAATAALPSNTYANGTAGVGATLTATVNGPLIIDGITIVTGGVGLRVLVAAESTGSHNGWYTITQVGVVAVSPYILTRAVQDDQAAEIGPGYLTGVVAPSGLSAGANNGKVYISLAPVPFVVGTDTVTFSQVGNTYTNGTGLTLTGSTFSLTNPVAVNLGGTGLAAITAHDLMIGNGTSAVTLLAPSATSGISLISQGASADPVYGTTVVAGGGTGVATLAAHGVMIGEGTSAVATTAAGTADQFFRSGGASADPAWATLVDDDAHIGPTGTLAVTYDRRYTTGSGGTAPTSGTVYVMATTLRAGQIIANANFHNNATAGASMTHFWGGIADSSRVVKAITADDTAAAWSATTTRTEALSYTAPTTDFYYLFLCSVGTTMPGILSAAAPHSRYLDMAPAIAGTADTGKTTPFNVGDTLATLTASSVYFYIWLT